MSSGVPIRASGVFSTIAFVMSGNPSSSGAVRAVAIIPGETALALIVGAYSSATDDRKRRHTGLGSGV